MAGHDREGTGVWQTGQPNEAPGVRVHFDSFRSFVRDMAPRISGEGVLLTTRTPRPPGSWLRFEMALDDDVPLIQGVGEVEWVRPSGRSGGTEMGLRFRVLEQPVRELVGRIVGAYTEQGGIPFELDKSRHLTTWMDSGEVFDLGSSRRWNETLELTSIAAERQPESEPPRALRDEAPSLPAEALSEAASDTRVAAPLPPAADAGRPMIETADDLPTIELRLPEVDLPEPDEPGSEPVEAAGPGRLEETGAGEQPPIEASEAAEPVVSQWAPGEVIDLSEPTPPPAVSGPPADTLSAGETQALPLAGAAGEIDLGPADLAATTTAAPAEPSGTSGHSDTQELAFDESVLSAPEATPRAPARARPLEARTVPATDTPAPVFRGAGVGRRGPKVGKYLAWGLVGLALGAGWYYYEDVVMDGLVKATETVTGIFETSDDPPPQTVEPTEPEVADLPASLRFRPVDSPDESPAESDSSTVPQPAPSTPTEPTVSERRPPEPSVRAPAPAPAPAVQPGTGAELALRRIEARPGPDATVVTLWLSRPPVSGEFTRFRVAEPPPRAVIKLRGAARPAAGESVAVGGVHLSSVRTGYHLERGVGTLHVVVDLADADVQLVSLETSGSQLVARFAPASQAGSGPSAP